MAALARLESWLKMGLSSYYDTRSGVLTADYSSKLSPWIALGCLSPLTVYWRVHAEVDSDSTRWFISELAWRDLFHYHLLYHGADVFRLGGPARARRSWSWNTEVFQRWSSGTTGIPYLDAHMRELKLSGFMSNTGRQLVANFFTCCLGMDWRMGAMWFEATLLDHDVAVNYGNWNREARIQKQYGRVHSAGLGCDPGGDCLQKDAISHFLARLYGALRGGSGPYDTDSFVRRWVPELTAAEASALVVSPSAVFPVLCASCTRLDRSSQLQSGRLLCASCRGACQACGAEGVDASGYCGPCWDEWHQIKSMQHEQ